MDKYRNPGRSTKTHRYAWMAVTAGCAVLGAAAVTPRLSTAPRPSPASLASLRDAPAMLVATPTAGVDTAAIDWSRIEAAPNPSPMAIAAYEPDTP